MTTDKTTKTPTLRKLLGFRPDQTLGAVDITPDMATEMLKLNRHNRPVSPREVARLERILKSGRYRYNGEAVKFDKAGDLRDGQHRLMAIQRSGVTAKLLIVLDLDKDAFTTFDQGRKRTGGDVLFLRKIKRYNAAAVACATLYRVLKNRPIYGAVDPIPAYGIDEVIERYPKLVSSIEYCAPMHSKGDTGIIGLGYLAAFHFIIEQVFEDPTKAASFVEGVTLGTGLKPDSPILQFRRRVMAVARRRDVMHAQTKTALVAKVVGMHMHNRHEKTLKDPPTDASYQTLIPGLKDRVAKMTPKSALRDLAY